MKIIEVASTKRVEMIEITPRVQELVRESKVKEGICVVFVPHTTAGVTINEHADCDVARDIETFLSKLVPQNGGFHHAEGNSDSHIKTLLTGNQVVIPINNGKLALGTWQGVFLCEYDGPRRRKVYITILGESHASL